MQNAIPTPTNWKQLCQALRKFLAVHADQHKDRTNAFKNHALKLQRYFSAVNTLWTFSYCVFNAFFIESSMTFVNLLHMSMAREDLDLKKYKKCICIEALIFRTLKPCDR